MTERYARYPAPKEVLAALKTLTDALDDEAMAILEAHDFSMTEIAAGASGPWALFTATTDGNRHWRLRLGHDGTGAMLLTLALEEDGENGGNRSALTLELSVGGTIRRPAEGIALAMSLPAALHGW